MKRTNIKLKGIPKVNLSKVIKLVKLCFDYSCFEFEGLLIDGDKVNIVKHYVNENPSVPFRTWLINTGIVIKEV